MATTTLKKKETHIGRHRRQQGSMAERACMALGWTMERYCRHQFSEYLKFTSELYKDYPVIREQVATSAVFRGYWNHQWSKRTQWWFLPYAEEYMDDLYEVNDLGELVVWLGKGAGHADFVDEYLMVHDHRHLMDDDRFMDGLNGILRLI